MKQSSKISELGSMMIEALAMLALIAMVTPVLYKKSAERTTELQDINAAGELRAIIKAVDDYISSNYDSITTGKTVENTCPTSSHDFSGFSGATNANMEVPIGHFCEFLPYGVLDDDGNAKKSRLFSNDYKVVLKLQGSADEGGDKVVTAFVVTDPNNENGLETVRASNIASMIGGNGGYVSEVSGEGEEVKGKISGNLGIWGIEDTKSELGISVKKGAVVAASIQGISSQNAKLDLDGVLYREEKSDSDLNTMSTTLYMGAKDAVTSGNNIVNIGQLIVGAQETDANDKLYIASGDIRLGDGTTAGNIYIDGTGGITLADGSIDVTGGDIVIKGEGTTEGSVENKVSLGVDGAISAASGAFNVATDGVVNALGFIAGDDENADAVQIHIEDKTTIKEPLLVEASGDCTPTFSEDGEITSNGDCALIVKGNAAVGGDLSVGKTFSAKDLHARNKLTVGGDTIGTGEALSVTYTKAAGEGGTASSALNFGNGLLNVSGAESNGTLNFSDFVSMGKSTTEGATNKSFAVNSADTIDMTTSSGTLKMNNNYLALGSDDNDNYATMYMGSTGETGAVGAGTIEIDASKYITMNSDAFVIQRTAGAEEGAVATNDIASRANTFTIVPTDAIITAGGPTQYFQIGRNTLGGANDKGQVLMQKIDTYMVDSSQYLQNGVFHLQSSSTSGEGEEQTTTHSDIVRIGESASSDSQIDISGEKIVAHEKGGTNQKVLKIDLDSGVTVDEEGNTSSSYSDENYPVYIRRGAIELKDGGYDEGHNYVQADRFVANTQLADKAFITHEKANAVGSEAKYEINPAYTSVMHDIKLTTRGGARLSDILPDFINKGIYVVDNTYPAKGASCGTQNGKSLSDYQLLERSQKQAVTSCDSITQEVSPWAGFVPTPTCPPGYSKVITLTPASFAMAQAGIPFSKDNRHAHTDLGVPYVVKSPYDYLEGSTNSDAPPTPLYYQKNTWLKSFVQTYGEGNSFEGWDVGMGFIYPYNLYKSYITEIGKSNFDQSGCDNDDTCVIWNMFPVYTGTLEGYATVYCYFNRAGGGFNPALVDTTYDQLNTQNLATDPFRASDSKDNSNYTGRLNDGRGIYGVW